VCWCGWETVPPKLLSLPFLSLAACSSVGPPFPLPLTPSTASPTMSLLRAAAVARTAVAPRLAVQAALSAPQQRQMSAKLTAAQYRASMQSTECTEQQADEWKQGQKHGTPRRALALLLAPTLCHSV
jgi:hypothetical protein